MKVYYSFRNMDYDRPVVLFLTNWKILLEQHKSDIIFAQWKWYQGNYLQKVTFYSNEGVIYTLPMAEYQNMPDRRIDRPMFRNNHFLMYRSPELISKLWPRARSSGCEHNQSNFEMKASVHGWHHWFLSFVDIGPLYPFA